MMYLNHKRNQSPKRVKMCLISVHFLEQIDESRESGFHVLGECMSKVENLASIHISEFIPPLSLFPPLIGSHFLLRGGINWVCETAPQAKIFWGPTHPVYSPPYWVTFFIKGGNKLTDMD